MLGGLKYVHYVLATQVQYPGVHVLQKDAEGLVRDAVHLNLTN